MRDGIRVELTPPSGAVEAHARALARLASRPRVAVVVPIFNASPSLKRCLDSLRAHAADAQVVLVDDSSGDPGVAVQVERFMAETAAASVVVNEGNLGFVRSANAGIRAADPDRDVVLLNSDTVVTTGWLDKLRAAALVVEDVATVNPLSNAADVFSLPTERVDNPLPAGWDPELCNRLLEKVSPRIYERVPATSGFCQYFRRRAIAEVGVFDDYLFHRGYGEDNDFCERAAAAGFVHVVDDATFIFHERGASFGATRDEFSRLNKAVLKALHPGHVKASLDWEKASKLDQVRRPYRDALEWLRELPPAEVEHLLETPTNRMRIVSNGDVAALPKGRVPALTLAVDAAQAEINLPGKGTERIPRPASVPGLASWLISRWGVGELDVGGGVIERPEEDRLRAAWNL